MIKLAFMVRRIEGMSPEEFVRHHREQHAPLFASIPEAKQYVRRYTISHPIEAPNYPAPTYDGLTEIWFDNWADHDAFFASDNYKTLVQPDEPTFVSFETSFSLVTEERTVI
ncbi:hypothetical protein GCM10022223_71010 [Kineosporia mesophila]|uniref:EthD domain-containing protein n=1 Tax=Kineosporia mesophila TaxID=566012 RepID=A0ABP7AVA2_9ACTN|nr:EthD domain-containing protein [Kineosporia mesophila]MCD5354064.1 EthD domain-containing protein [Kineosporia mesophila]